MTEPWNLTSEQWAKVLSNGAPPQAVAQRLLKGSYLPWNEVLLKEAEGAITILDLGCGRGEHSAVLALQGKQTTLLDWSDENLDFSKKLYESLGQEGKFYKADMTGPLPFADHSFDLVFSCGVFEYFSDEQITSILKEMFRVTRQKVVIMVPNACSLFYRLGMWYMQLAKNWPWGGERPFVTLQPHFRAVGFKTIKEFTVAAKHSLNFLTMPGGKILQKVIRQGLNLRDQARPALLRQGYLLVTIGEK